MSDDVAVEILLKWKQQDEQVVGQAIAQLAALQAATVAWNAVTLAGAPTWLAIGTAVALTAAALSPLLALVGAAAGIMVTFAVAGTATLVLLGGLAAGFAAIGAAVLLLGGGSLTGSAGLATATTQLAAAQQALKDFNALNTGAASGPSAASQRRLFDAQQALEDFVALHPGTLTPALVRQQEDLQLAVTRAQAAAQGGPGGLSLSQRLQQEDLQLRVTQAQQKYNDALLASQAPLAVLGNQLGQMKDAWAAQAVPLAAMITQWVAGAIPAVTQLGQALMTWFGDRLPGVLKEIGNVISALGPTFGQFASFLGATFDKFSPLIGPLMVQAVQFFVGALTGLINTFSSLAAWFNQTIWLADSFATRQKALGDIVGQVFGAIGAAVIVVAGVWGKFADWLIFQWPNIVTNAQTYIKGMQDQWNLMAPTLSDLASKLLPAMGDAIKYISQHGATLGAVLSLVAGGLLVVAAIALSVAASITAITNAIVGATNAVIAFYNAAGVGGGGAPQSSYLPASRGGYITPPQTSSQSQRAQTITQTINVQSTGNPAADGALIARALRAGFAQ